MNRRDLLKRLSAIPFVSMLLAPLLHGQSEKGVSPNHEIDFATEEEFWAWVKQTQTPEKLAELQAWAKRWVRPHQNDAQEEWAKRVLKPGQIGTPAWYVKVDSHGTVVGVRRVSARVR